jgi:L-amino acid N-acyltransferase YncA
MYKGYTHTRHRGRRLHAVGMTRALESYLARGYKGFVSYVEASNFSSLKSCYRMGYVNFGTIVALRVFNRYFLYANKGCRRYGFRLVEREAGDRQAAIVAPSPGE